MVSRRGLRSTDSFSESYQTDEKRISRRRCEEICTDKRATGPGQTGCEGTRAHDFKKDKLTQLRLLRYSINVTLDGYCDHRAVIADEDLHRHAAEILDQTDAFLFGGSLTK
jgi:hypothetical protein